MAKQIKEIRVSFSTDAARETVKNFTVLSVIKGVSFEIMLSEAMQLFIEKNGSRLSEGRWVSQTELIERLKTDHGIYTNPQTLSNYRSEGRFDGIFCSDGESKVYYLLEKVAEKLQEPRTRQKPQKTAAV